MKKTKSVAMRLDSKLSARIEASKRRIEKERPGFRVTWSDVVRGLVEAGLERDEENAEIRRAAKGAGF